MTHKIAILTNGDRAWASSRLRGYWLEDANPVRFKVYGPGQSLDGIDDCDVVVFQKRQQAADVERAMRYKAQGKSIVYDLTDPMWWFEPIGTNAMIRVADVVTTSCEGLSDVIRQNEHAKMVVTIEDRMLPSYHPTVAQHGKRDRVRLVWFGATNNRVSLVGALPLLSYVSHRFPIELRVIDGAPHVKLDEIADPERTKVVHIPWALETFHAHLAASDIALLPPFPGPWGDLKSNNKQVTAWWAGLPVVTGFDLEEMVDFIADHELRATLGAANRAAAEKDWGIGKSIAQWLELAAELRDTPAIQRDVIAHPETLTEYAPTAAGD